MSLFITPLFRINTLIYAATIQTEANTTEANAVRTILRVSKGLVWRIEVEFPPGCSGLAYLQIFDGAYQMFPSSIGEGAHSDAAIIGFDDLYMKSSEPFEFVIKTWNLDDTWNHTLQVRLGMASSEAYMSRYLPSASWESFSKMIASAEAEQEKQREVQRQVLLEKIGEL